MLALYARSVVRDDGWPEKNERVEQQQQQKGEKIFLILYTCPSAMHNKDGSIVYIYTLNNNPKIYIPATCFMLLHPISQSECFSIAIR
jgi:hypothetical protein